MGNFYFSLLGIVSFLTLLICLAIKGLTSNIKNSNEVYDKLEEIYSKAKKSRDFDEINKLYLELKDYAEKNCWHKYHSYKVREVGNYILGKLSGIHAATFPDDGK